LLCRRLHYSVWRHYLSELTVTTGSGNLEHICTRLNTIGLLSALRSLQIRPTLPERVLPLRHLAPSVTGLRCVGSYVFDISNLNETGFYACDLSGNQCTIGFWAQLGIRLRV
jgi:hypothetical protein